MGLATETFKRKFPRSMQAVANFNASVDNLSIGHEDSKFLKTQALNIALVVAEEALELKKNIDMAKKLLSVFAKVRR